MTDHALALGEWPIVLSAAHRLLGTLLPLEWIRPSTGERSPGRPFSWRAAASEPAFQSLPRVILASFDVSLCGKEDWLWL